jgi:DNA polymerase-3 subunit gamma/tau
MSLYTKYRPLIFSDIIGQDIIKNILSNTSSSRNFSHAYLLSGVRGTGKTTTARILSRSINCINIKESGDPCLNCNLCKLSLDNKLTDIVEIDAASNRGIDEIRELREKISFSPNLSNSKIYIIDEVHMLTKEAFNALLKTLEEPPNHAYFILATTEYNKLPETIISRCQTFIFKNISIDNIVNHLSSICDKENIKYEKEALNIIAKKANGGLRDALSILDRSINLGSITLKNLKNSLGFISDDFLENFLDELYNNNNIVFNLFNNFLDEQRSLDFFSISFLEFLQKKMYYYLNNNTEKLTWLIDIIEIFEKYYQKSKKFELPSLAIEIAIAKSLLLKNNKKTIKTDIKISKLVKEKKNTPLSEKNNNVTIDYIKSNWNTLFNELPSSLRLNLLQYSKPITFIDNILSIKVTIDSVKSVLSNIKNKEKIEKHLTDKLSISISLKFIEEKKIKENLSVLEVEDLLQF